MKRVSKWLALALMALLMMLTVTGALAAGPYGMATADQVIVRKQPSTDAGYWFRIDKGFVCEIMEVVTEGDDMWYKVCSTHPTPNGRTYIGYVAGDFFRALTLEEEAALQLGDGDAASMALMEEEEPEESGIRLTVGMETVDRAFDVGIMGGEAEEDTSGSTGGTGNSTLQGALGVITASGTNFRIAPSTDADLIGKLDADTVVELITIPEQVGSAYWYRVRCNGQEGYVQSLYVRVLSYGTVVTPGPSAYGYAKLLKDTGNLRDAPAGETMATWRGKGSLLQIVGPSTIAGGYTWYPVYYGASNKTYYVRHDIITVVSGDGSAVVVTPTPTPVPEAGNGYGYGYVRTTKAGVNLRLKPAGETIAQVPRNRVLVCIGPAVHPVDSSYTWYYVTWNGLKGYLRGDCVKVCDEDGGSIVATPTPAPEVSPTPGVSVGTFGYVKLTKGGVNLRLTPAGTSVDQLPKNLILPLTGNVVTISGSRYTWYPVLAPDGKTGYVRSDCIMLCDAEGNKVTATPTPAPVVPENPGSGSTTPGLSTYGYVKITAAGTNLRETVAGETIHQLKKNTVWPMTGNAVTYSGYTWYPITAEGYTGFVRGDCAFKLSASQELSYLQGNGVPNETPAPTPAMSSYVITVVDYVNLRASASRDAAAPYKVRTGTVMAYNTVKTVGTSTWYRIVYKDSELWVLGTCVEVMTAAEYEAWLAQNPSANPDTSAAKGYLITVEAGVNVRNLANGPDILDRLKRGTVVPYFAGPVSGGGYNWYRIRTASGVDGYIRSDMVKICDEGGNVAPTPTPTPGTGTPQEATYTTLRLGSTGTAVKNLVTELIRQGFYSGSVTSSYTSDVRAAVMAFQTAKGLTVDGIAGSKTQHALYGTVPPGTTDTSNLSFEFYPVEKIDWFTGGIQQLWAKGANYKVYDVKTGIVWWAHRWSGAYHADIETLTAADTERLCKIYGTKTAQEIWDKNLWQRRPCLVTIGTRTFACSLFGMPHNPDGDTIPNNNMTGQICLHFTNSKGHDSGKVDTYHQKAIEEAYNSCPAGKK